MWDWAVWGALILGFVAGMTAFGALDEAQVGFRRVTAFVPRA